MVKLLLVQWDDKMHKRIRRIFYFVLLICSSYASAWVELGKNLEEGIAISFDKKSIIHKASFTQAKVLYNFAKPNSDMNILHSSEVEWVTFDCPKRTLRLDDVQWFKNQFAKGAVVWQTKNLEWQKLEKGTSYEVLFQQICPK